MNTTPFGWQPICAFFFLAFLHSLVFCECSQTSRIEIKKGPNGVDYEYEYVYYYYDDDEADSGSTNKSTSPAAVEKAPPPAPLEPSRTSSSVSSSSSNVAGKTRYTATDRSNNAAQKQTADRNEIPASRGKGRQSIPVVEEVAEERLPANTRFPPRSAITPTVQVISSIEETTKKISVKRPSLDLVDSHSFNRGDKNQSKGTRIVASEFDKDADLKAKKVSNVSVSDDVSDKSSGDSTTAASETEEPTTQVMDKVALDLYAHLANENSNVDATTDLNEESGTNADSTEATASTDEYTTAEATTLIVTTTTTTTTPAPTTTTTTTTTEAPIVHTGRRAPYGAGRNRFRSRPTARTVASEIPVEVREVSAAETSPTKPKSKHSVETLNFGKRRLIIFSAHFRPFLTSIVW